MRKGLLYAAASILLAVCVTFVLWQGSFSFGDLEPQSVGQVFLYWSVSSLVFILTVTLGFMLFRTGVKLYYERQTNKEGSRIRTKMVVGAFLLSFLPVLFLVLFSVQILNFNLTKWFSRPGQNIRMALSDVSGSLESEMAAKVRAQARLLASMPEVVAFSRDGETLPATVARICREERIVEAWIRRADGARLPVCSSSANDSETESLRAGAASVPDASGLSGSQLIVTARAPVDLVKREAEIRTSIDQFDQLSKRRKEVRNFYLLLLALISLFVLFVSTWIAIFLARQISIPISALLGAAREVRGGNLGYRVRAPATDELASLVRAFNEMTQDLEANQKELERRRRFTEAILDNVPAGVLSLASDGRILNMNSALKNIFPKAAEGGVTHLEELFPREEAAELRYLMKRARRTGIGTRQFEFRDGRRTLHLAVIVSPIEENLSSGFVMVIEDTSELLRAQKSEAWHEVARRIAHEIKNPLTPISLCAERLARQIDKLKAPPETARILLDCTNTITQEVESVRTLVDEFSQYARFPAAQPVFCDINDIVENALSVFAGRLEGIELYKDLSRPLPQLWLDPEQMKRVIVNLVDNAAEAMQDAPLRRLFVSTSLASPESVELIISDTGGGISAEDREKLFLPYFSTKGRGTGLGLAIVSHILADHRAQIRVEDNVPAGARFIVEIPVPTSREHAADDMPSVAIPEIHV